MNAATLHRSARLVQRLASPRPTMLRSATAPYTTTTTTMTAARSTRRAPIIPAARRMFATGPPRRAAQSVEDTVAAGKEKVQSLSARMKHLSKEYGWAAVGVYLALSALDLPICFVLVRLMGAERIGELEHAVVSSMGQYVPESVKHASHQVSEAVRSMWHSVMGTTASAGHDGQSAVEAAMEEGSHGASLGTQLALAYAIHKSVFIFVRVPLTAAFTPRIVKTLRGWGWKIGRSSKA